MCTRPPLPSFQPCLRCSCPGRREGGLQQTITLCAWMRRAGGLEDWGYQCCCCPLPTFIHLRRFVLGGRGSHLVRRRLVSVDDWHSLLRGQAFWQDFGKWSKSFSLTRVGTERRQAWLTLQLTLRRPGLRWTSLQTWRLWRKPERGGGVPGNGLNANGRYHIRPINPFPLLWPVSVMGECHPFTSSSSSVTSLLQTEGGFVIESKMNDFTRVHVMSKIMFVLTETFSVSTLIVIL